ncbi:DUF547 domain-containing protein [Hirschia litorea]|uniref:DUF547 domain-containing protein n=1 Tax=Hirschia litorea TaxID=1199156 RepID=A0ABW2IJY2_9PROT
MRSFAMSVLVAVSLAFPLQGALAQEPVVQDVRVEQHGAWTEILQAYVQVNQDGINRFDYARLKQNPNDLQKLDKYIQQLAVSDVFKSGTDDEQFAAWANLYNALTIQLVTEKYPVKSIRDIGGNFIQRGPWKKDIVKVQGKDLSLDDIEHGILRKKWNDPRVHYAVNCASLGCPNLLKKAWEAQSLDVDLNQAASNYINHPRGVSVREDGRLVVSKIYDWFSEDFGGSQVGEIMHFMKFASPELVSHLSAETMIKSYRYDWSLNDVKEKGE